MPILIVLALIGAGLYFVYDAYGTLSPCAALRVAYEADSEAILGEMMIRDPETRTIDVVAMMGQSTEGTRRLADAFERETTRDGNVLRCTYLVAYRAVNADGFQETVAQDILDAQDGIPPG